VSPDTDFRIGRRSDEHITLSSLGATLAFEMDAAVWTAIGLLAATSLGSLFYLGSRIDGLANRIDALGARLDARLDGIESRIDAHLERHAAG
jgi:hypothetical protein